MPQGAAHVTLNVRMMRTSVRTGGLRHSQRMPSAMSVCTGVRGESASLSGTGVAAIRETVRTLKPKPGVYRMLDARGDVLYVGKARSLKARVANYTQVKALSNRLKRMVSQCRSMEIVTTNSEAEALLRGRPATLESFLPAAEALIEGARGQGQNDFKIPMARQAILRALSQAAAGTPQTVADKRIQ